MIRVGAVPIDDAFGEMVNCAVRYCLGRQTYAAKACVDYIMPIIPQLDDTTLKVIKNDIEGAENKPHGLGADFDAKEWRRLLTSIKQELVDRLTD